MSNIKLKDENSISAVVAELTLLEKAKLCGGATAFETHAVERLGIPTVVMADGHNGINIYHLFGNYVPHAASRAGIPLEDARGAVSKLRRAGPAGLKALIRGDLSDPALEKMLPEHRPLLSALIEELRRELPDKEGLPSCFPTGIVMSATWDPELVAECGSAVAKEARSFGMDIVLGPNVNIHRDPLCGRVFESYSEDPYQTSRIAVRYIQGVQREGVAAVVKHYVANNQEHERMTINTIVGERALREIYYPAFKASIQEGGSWMVMSAYNSVNGEFCAMNAHLLKDVLRDEWGFSGFVVSDWGAAYDRTAALIAGNDLEMPGPCDPQAIVDAVERGKLDLSVLDARVENILRIMLKLPVFLGKPREPIDREASADVARRVATDGMVLLKNKDSALPFSSGKISVLGSATEDTVPTGKGSAWIISPYTVTISEGLRSRFGDGNVTVGEINPHSDLVVVAVRSGSGEGSDRDSLDLAPEDVSLIRSSGRRCRELGTRCVVILNVCGPVEVESWSEEVDAVILSWMAGQEIGHAVADLLSGDVCPSGKLPITFPKRYADTPTSLSFPGEFGEVRYGEGIFVGYRYYDTADVEPLYEFGYGLSYTSFAIGKVSVGSDIFCAGRGEAVSVAVEVKNTGSVSGKEVVQLYVQDVSSTVRKPEKELKGFQKVEIESGDTAALTFDLTDEAFSHFDTQKNAWCVEPGLFEILVGTSSKKIQGRASLRVRGANPYAHNSNTSIARIMRDENAVGILEKYLPEQALADPQMKEIVEFLPHVAFDRVWNQIFIHHLGESTPQEAAKIREQIFSDFADLQVD